MKKESLVYYKTLYVLNLFRISEVNLL
jgi:hypothetical protein